MTTHEDDDGTEQDPARRDEVAAPDAEEAVAPVRPLDQHEAESLCRRLQDRAATIAEETCAFLLMLSEFDEREGLRWFPGLKTIAHWVSWSCSMSPGAAREHVRVARALRSMPRTVAEFSAGRLSFSKVREMTRVVDRVGEEILVELAGQMTAAQLARTVGGVRSVAGHRIGQECLREASWSVREDGMIEVRAVLPPETGAELVNSIEHAMGRDDAAPAQDDGGLPDPLDSAPEDPAPLAHRRADALVEVARGYLAGAPEDRSGQDTHLVVVQVSAEALAADAGPADPHAHDRDRDDDDAVPGLTTPRSAEDEHRSAARREDDRHRSDPRTVEGQRARVLGLGPVEAATAARLSCTDKVALQVVGSGGEVLHLGRARRLASRAQRRALRLRDETCRFPGCHQRSHLDAHHLRAWTAGGPTDVGNLVLLCRRHHVMVHEGRLHLAWADAACFDVADVPAGTRDTSAGQVGVTYTADVPAGTPRAASPSRPQAPAAADVPAGTRRLLVLDSAGRPVQAHWPPMLEAVQHRPDPSITAEKGEHGRGDHGDPERIFPPSGGAGFDLQACVTALLENSGRVIDSAPSPVRSGVPASTDSTAVAAPDPVVGRDQKRPNSPTCVMASTGSPASSVAARSSSASIA